MAEQFSCPPSCWLLQNENNNNHKKTLDWVISGRFISQAWSLLFTCVLCLYLGLSHGGFKAGRSTEFYLHIGLWTMPGQGHCFMHLPTLNKRHFAQCRLHDKYLLGLTVFGSHLIRGWIAEVSSEKYNSAPKCWAGNKHPLPPLFRALWKDSEWW